MSPSPEASRLFAIKSLMSSGSTMCSALVGQTRMHSGPSGRKWQRSHFTAMFR